MPTLGPAKGTIGVVGLGARLPWRLEGILPFPLWNRILTRLPDAELSSHGFVVIQPTFLDATALGLREADDPDAPLYTRTRAEDMSLILDQLDLIEKAVPQLVGRLDRDKVAAVGHSLGGHTAALLLGMQFEDPSQGGRKVSLVDRRIRAGVLMAGPGRGGDALHDRVVRLYPALNAPDFSTMRTPALVVAGDKDLSTTFTDLGASWRMDP
ncbi:alpha/beta hydrolase family protein [Phytohabitans sp. LJ34]|uniref:alpha/beta hydrolase family protein n=1 Tax=Phytohabitans sp. LJ34 TaxID=3452217 RepID=UPI003F8C8029